MTGKHVESTELEFWCPIYRSAIGQASCLISAYVVNWRCHSVANLACKNICFSSLFAAEDVSPGGTSAT